jgi:hypothetical protein
VRNSHTLAWPGSAAGLALKDSLSGCRQPSLADVHPGDHDLHSRSMTMSHEQKSNKEARKKPAMTPKEKKAAKKSKKEAKGFLDSDRTR